MMITAGIQGSDKTEALLISKDVFVSVGYNSRTKDYLILDGKGITLWNKDAVDGAG